MTGKNISLRDYWNQLNHHDWYYENSDDFRVWKAGQQDLDRLTALAQASDKHKALLDGFAQHYFSGPSFGTPKAPKPPRP